MCNAHKIIYKYFALCYNQYRGDFMKNVNITLRVDDELKKQADSLFSELGLSLTAAFNIFLRQSVREQRIPFQITKSLPNATTIAAINDAENGRNLYGPYDNVKDLMEELNAKD